MKINLGLAVLGVSIFASLVRITYLNYTKEMDKEVSNKFKFNSVANDKRGNMLHIMASPNTMPTIKNNTVNCGGGHSAPTCADCTRDNQTSLCHGDCESSSKYGACQLRPSSIVRLASKDTSVRDDNCNFFYVRVPKTGSTSIHNTIVRDENARQQVCSQKKHVPIPVLDNKYHVGIFLVTVRDPYERFASQYRYLYGDIGHSSKALQLSFKVKYPHIDHLVSDLNYAQSKFLKTLYWMSMTHFVPLEWVKENRKRVTFLCASSNYSTSLHEQLEETLGIEIEGMQAHHNPTEGVVRGVTTNFTVLSERSKNILAGSFLKSDLELYRLSGCSTLKNETTPLSLR
mmetsp:Transcript_19896/g.43151  ORF Transcript_19896/g.43151 Transcript_19896/m.43151 type:complete len:344 (-) Transcript_19896:511-1542(-)|eukprot:CAMPEP_0172316968 /NCGR_PEP_ID=MMETSP1058-20130122/30143_1 /TAXON_ID=83371 /ORGANISM="Detonula confervacea, Strain CCMP 353" /LENGTH=343 /DNA_ID=CAMNT_0013031411 /DNA_START=229 /DNA_END=1260 /DNA_ORIENTATION=-